MLQETIIKDQPLRRWQDYVVPQRWLSFTQEDHAVWDLLFARQVELLGTRVVSAFLDGIDLLRLSHPGVPDVDGLNAILEPRTGWRVVAVPGLVPDPIFFAMLNERPVPSREFHPPARTTGLSRGAGLLPRHVRAYPDARRTMISRQMVELSVASGLTAIEAGEGDRARKSIGTAWNSGSRRKATS